MSEANWLPTVPQKLPISIPFSLSLSLSLSFSLSLSKALFLITTSTHSVADVVFPKPRKFPFTQFQPFSLFVCARCLFSDIVSLLPCHSSKFKSKNVFKIVALLKNVKNKRMEMVALVGCVTLVKTFLCFNLARRLFFTNLFLPFQIFKNECFKMNLIECFVRSNQNDNFCSI